MNNIKGLEIFKEKFKKFIGNYVIIGGTACKILLESMYIDFRSTKDIDMVLIAENMTNVFKEAIIEFVYEGKYEIWKDEYNKCHYFRFQKPKNDDFPYMIELLSINDSINFNKRYTPLFIKDEKIKSLSAIIIDEDYYNLIVMNKIILNDLSIANSKVLALLKMKAYIDIFIRKKNDLNVFENPKKHQNDVYRLVEIFNNEKMIVVDSIKQDIKKFLELNSLNDDILKQLKIRTSKAQLDDIIRRTFNIK